MPRDSNGQYTLPPGNPVISDTFITSNWGNTTMGDIGNEITNSLDRTGRGGMTGPFGVVDGTSAQPGLRFIAETTTGFARTATGTFVASVQGSSVVTFSSSGIQVVPGSAANPSIRMEGGPTGFYNAGSGVVGVAVAGVKALTIDGEVASFGADAGGTYREIAVNGPVGFARFALKTASVYRWIFGLNAVTDDYVVTAMNDVGATIDQPLTIVRAAGGGIQLGGAGAIKRPVAFTGPAIYVNQAAAPATPAASNVALYSLAGVLTAKDSNGGVFPVAPLLGNTSVKGLQATATTTVYTFSASGYVLRNVAGGLVFSSITGSVPVNINTAGPVGGGRDQAAAFAAGAEVHFYALLSPDGSTLSGVASLSAVAPTIPAGYSYYCYLGSIVMSGANLQIVYQRGSDIVYPQFVTVLEAFSIGVGNVPWTQVTQSLINVAVPAIADKMDMLCSGYRSSTTGGDTSFRWGFVSGQETLRLNVSPASGITLSDAATFRIPARALFYSAVVFGGTPSTQLIYAYVRGYSVPNGTN